MPWLALLRSKWLYIGLLVAALGVQTLRVGHYHAKAEACATARKNDRRAYELAAKEAAARQKAANDAVEARYKHEAEESDREHHKALADARGAAERYIAAHRLRQVSRGSPGSPGAPAQGPGPSVPDDAPAGTELVAVRADDLRDCAADYAYARSAYEYAQGLIVNKLAVPVGAPDPAFGGEAHSPTVEP